MTHERYALDGEIMISYALCECYAGDAELVINLDAEPPGRVLSCGFAAKQPRIRLQAAPQHCCEATPAEFFNPIDLQEVNSD